MNRSILLGALLTLFFLGACDRPVVYVPAAPEPVPGPPGPQGATGEMGSQGATGYQGEKGATGYQGDTGSQGATGYQGATGKPGENTTVIVMPPAETPPKN